VATAVVTSAPQEVTASPAAIVLVRGAPVRADTRAIPHPRATASMRSQAVPHHRDHPGMRVNTRAAPRLLGCPNMRAPIKAAAVVTEVIPPLLRVHIPIVVLLQAALALAEMHWTLDLTGTTFPPGSILKYPL